MFNARTKDDLPLNEVVLWGIEPGSFLEPAVNRGEQLGRLENGVVIASKLVEKGIDIGDVLILDRVLTELEVVGVTDEHYIGHVPVIYTLLPKWQEATYGPPGGPPPGEKLPSILFDYASVIALQIKPDTLPGELQTTDEDLGTITIDKTAAYQASSGYVEEVRTVQMIQVFLFVISAVVMGAFFSVWTLQRTKEIGLVKALGASNIYLLKDSLGQVLLLMIGATVIGTLGAIQVGRLMEGSGFPYLLVPETVTFSAVILIIAGLFGSALSLRLINITAEKVTVSGTSKYGKPLPSMRRPTWMAPSVPITVAPIINNSTWPSESFNKYMFDAPSALTSPISLVR
jgi:putative ABC transport system permease protein